MEIKIEKLDWIFLLLCLLVGILAEEVFIIHQIGVSYFLFIVIFYSLFYWRFQSFSFTHQRFGYLLLISIWILSAGYTLYDTKLFSSLNILAIPTLVIFHLVLITSPEKVEWCKLSFIPSIIHRLFEGIRYNVLFANRVTKLLKGSGKQNHFHVWKKILLGVVISIPFLFIILNLLSAADAQFGRIITSLPHLLSFRGDYIFRLVIVLVFTCSFFGFMQVLLQSKFQIVDRKGSDKAFVLDGIITLTVLLLIDIVYVLFVVVQFKYFFSGSLGDGYTYAEYARRGFFELLFVTMINLTITTGVIYFTNNVPGFLKKAIQLALTILVLSSGVLLTSAFMRMKMYEDAYGFTFLRVLVHSFMIFLIVIFAYTLVKIWLEKLSLFHFYFIAALIYYSGINIVNVDKIVIDQNIARFEETGKIDIGYLSDLSSSGVLGLIQLYEKNPDIPGLKDLLQQRKAESEQMKNNSWLSYNFTREKLYEKLRSLDF